MQGAFERWATPGKSLALAAGIIGLTIDGLYLGIILSQEDEGIARVVVVAVFLALASGCALVGALGPMRLPGPRLVALGAAAGGLLTLGFLALLSIGFPLLVAGVMCVIAWTRLARSARPVPGQTGPASVAAAVAAGAILLAGIAAT